jgi:hypothetical protein
LAFMVATDVRRAGLADIDVSGTVQMGRTDLLTHG